MAIAAILLGPLALAALVRLLQSPAASAALPVAWGVAGLALSATLAAGATCSAWFCADAPAAFMLLTVHAVFLAAAAGRYEAVRRDAHDAPRVARQTAMLLLFLAAMTGVALSAHLALLWVFVEATTLVSAPLVYAERGRTSLEAAWKYVFIGSVGIALAFIGVILLSIATGGASGLGFADLEANAARLDPFWLKCALPFLLVGFGTKAGLAPVHAWLPDAHSEAPAPVSALLSGALLGTALLPALRLKGIVAAAGLAPLHGRLLMLMGFLSLLVAAVYLARMHNYKRLLAYSSIEHLGVVAVGLGAGGTAAFAAMLHLSAHALAKSACFLAAGCILDDHGTKEIADCRGIAARRPALGWTWALGFAALAGLPPFPTFFTEVLLIMALVDGGHPALAALLCLLLLVATVAAGRAVIEMAFGAPAEAKGRRPAGSLAVAAPALALLALAALGLLPPAPFVALAARAAGW